MTKAASKSEPPAGRCRRLFRRIWCPLRERWRSVADLRFTAAILVAGTALMAVQAGQDVVASISDDWETGAGTRAWWLFVAAVWFLGLQAWLWSRFLIQLRHGSGAAMRRDRLLVHLPRILGTIPYAAAAFTLWRVPEGTGNGWQAALLALLGLLAYAFYWQRLRIVAWLSGWNAARYLFEDEDGLLGMPRFLLWTLVLSLLLAAVSIAWLALDPVTLPRLTGSAALAFLALALVLPPVNLAIGLVSRERFPVLTGLVALGFVSSCFNDNHEVRSIKSVALPQRPNLEAAYLQWVAQAPRDPDRRYVTAVLVSAEGGASRAGLWTLEALQRLDGDEYYPDINRRIFAISTVSGSALGAVDYVAGIAAYPHGDTPDIRSARHALSRGHVGTDFLAPAFGGLLYTDMFQRFIPFPFMPDRAESIERGFEAAWVRECDARGLGAQCAALMSGPFLDLWRPGRSIWRPNLLLVGAVEEDGRRIVTSNIELVELHRGGRRPLLPNVYDYFEVTGRHVASATAVMNSARFPWLSPAGRMVDGTGNSRGHIIDGGYFETSAADTSEDLAGALRATNLRLCPQESEQCPRLRFVFLTLLNGEIIEDEPIDNPPPPRPRCHAPGDPVEEGGTDPDERLRPDCQGRMAANDALAPIRGLFNAQFGRATRPLTRLARLEERAPGVPVAIRLRPCRRSAQRPLAMNWVLSELTRERVRQQLADARLQPIPAPQPTRCLTGLQAAMSSLARALDIPMPPQPAVPPPPAG